MIILSNIPGVILNFLLHGYPVSQWIYLGKSDKVLYKLKRFLPSQAHSIDYARKLYELSEKWRDQYIRWIDEISFSGPISKEWLFSVPAVKNPYISNVYLYLCYFFVLEEYLREDKKIDLVIVDSPALSFLLKKYFSKRIRSHPINAFLGSRIYLEVFFRTILRFFRHAIDFARAWVAAKRVFKDRCRKLLRDKKIILIRNYITVQYLKSKTEEFDLRYFPKLYSYLQEHNSVPVFLPLAVVRNYRKLYKKVRESKQLIIFPEEFYKVRDYFNTFSSPLRALCYPLKIPELSGYSFAPLIREEYYANLTQSGILNAILLSCFGRRLKQSAIDLKGIINWAEFQAFEKGLVSGLREAFPAAKFIGSQPFLTAPNHMSLIPSQQERLLRLIPDRLLVLGPLGKRLINDYTVNVNVDFTPAFRYQSVFKSFSSRNGEHKNILVLMGYSLTNAVHTMKILCQCREYLQDYQSVYIKLHPVANYNKEILMKETIMALPHNFKFVEGALESYLEKISLSICGGSGTAVEVVLRGIPVILIADSNTLTMNYLSYKRDPYLWRLCFSQDEVKEALQYFRKILCEQPEQLSQKALEFRRLYFAEPDNRYWENYLIRE